ncbi:hypothetical protein N473_26630 [Pseudoalteromonas luteoviolacea CPMOR-1]|uniref:Uncharacterized protein n=1 Tax=Pseudoalteromonas luteoviolacea CPMOR-1 TaxID=1365248 RepID=A0A167HBC1_9GAMM|nr:hypothetical protein [Pseudoalteromonas luteoviolacea]KZN57934.1 hypothetical protein N473_26630 [Pseudoalteromonas luteoviolacea CPMOR-1]
MTQPLEVLDALVKFFSAFAPSERGFYRSDSLGRDQDKKITIQVLELSDGKPQQLDVLAVLTHRANGALFENADKLLLELANEIKLAIEKESKSINSALDGKAIEFALTESIKILPPEPQDNDAKAVFSLRVKFK